MVLDPKKARLYMKEAGLTEQKLQQAAGKIVVNKLTAKASGVSKDVVQNAVSSIRMIARSCGIVSGRYNTIALKADADPRDVTNEEDVAADQALLEELFAPEYTLTDPAGNVVDRDETIETILSGKIRKVSLGKGGFEGSDGVLQVHGSAAILVGEFKMNATQLAKNKKTGQVKRFPRKGTFRSTHTYIFRDDRWQLAASHLTQSTPQNLPTDWVYSTS